MVQVKFGRYCLDRKSKEVLQLTQGITTSSMLYMTYQTILTSKGTTTIPVEIRKRLGIKPGMYVLFEEDKSTGQFILKRPQSIEEVRAMNKTAMKNAGTADVVYKSGDGFTAYVKEKYGDHA